VNFSQTVVKDETEATGEALVKLVDAVLNLVSMAGSNPTGEARYVLPFNSRYLH